MIEQSSGASASQVTKPRRGFAFWWMPWVLSLALIGAVGGFLYQTQIVMLEELKSERVSRTQAEERSTQIIGKLTERLIEKTTEAHNAAMAELVKQNSEQQQIINEVKSQIVQLTKKQRKPHSKNGKRGL